MRPLVRRAETVSLGEPKSAQLRFGQKLSYMALRPFNKQKTAHSIRRRNLQSKNRSTLHTASPSSRQRRGVSLRRGGRLSGLYSRPSTLTDVQINHTRTRVLQSD